MKDAAIKANKDVIFFMVGSFFIDVVRADYAKPLLSLPKMILNTRPENSPKKATLSGSLEFQHTNRPNNDTYQA
jgi:hypothetical protein